MSLHRQFLFSVVSFICVMASSQELTVTPKNNESNSKKVYHQKSLKTNESVPKSKTFYNHSKEAKATKVGKDVDNGLKAVEDNQVPKLQKKSSPKVDENSERKYPTSLTEIEKVEKKTAARSQKQLEPEKVEKDGELELMPESQQLSGAFVVKESPINQVRKEKPVSVIPNKAEPVSKHVQQKEHRPSSKTISKKSMPSTQMLSTGK